jgi:sortase B
MKRLKKIIRIVLGLVFLTLIVFSAYMIFNWYVGTRNNKKITKTINNKIKIENVRDGQSEIDFDYLVKTNSDTVGYLMVDNLDINYPVVRSTNNDYYLNHSFDKNKNVAGWIFMDYRNSDINTDKNTIIYGHNMKDGSMFGSLKKLKGSNPGTITYMDSNNTYKYKVFSIYEVEAEDYYISAFFNSDDDYLSFINKIKSRSIYNYDYSPNISDKILTLSTCSSGNKRLVVHAYKNN